jgi:hypothetical protein
LPRPVSPPQPASLLVVDGDRDRGRDGQRRRPTARPGSRPHRRLRVLQRRGIRREAGRPEPDQHRCVLCRHVCEPPRQPRHLRTGHARALGHAQSERPWDFHRSIRLGLARSCLCCRWPLERDPPRGAPEDDPAQHHSRLRVACLDLRFHGLVRPAGRVSLRGRGDALRPRAAGFSAIGTGMRLLVLPRHRRGGGALRLAPAADAVVADVRRRLARVPRRARG